MGTEILIESLGYGVVRIGREGPSPVGSAILLLPGAVLYIDPMYAAGAVWLVSDAEAASETLAQLYGQAFALEVAAVATSEEGVTRLVVPEPDVEALRVLLRLGTLRWVQANSPLPLDRRLLRAEELVLVAQAAQLEDEHWGLGELAQLCRYLVAARGEFEPAAGLLREGLEIVALHSSAGSSDGDWARAQLAASPAVSGPGHLEEDASWLHTLEPEYALAAGETGPTYAGATTADWRCLPPGWISAQERNVQWAAEFEGDSARLTVAVYGPEPVKWLGGRPWGKMPGAGSLGWHMVLGDDPLPCAAGALRFDAVTGWVGEARCQGAQARALRDGIAAGGAVQVFIWHPETGLQRCGQSVATRWSVRGLSLARLCAGTDSEPVRIAAARAVAEAAAAWLEGGHVAEAEACRMMLDEAGSLDLLTVAERWLVG